MTETEWLVCEEPFTMLESLGVRCSQRKLTLYLCAGLRRLWHILYDERSREGVEVLERVAEDEATPAEVKAACYYAESPTFGYHFEPGFVRNYRTSGEATSVERLLALGVYTEQDIFGDAQMGEQHAREQLLNLTHIVYHCFYQIKNGQLDKHLLEHLSSQDDWPKGNLVRECFGSRMRPAVIDHKLLTPNVVSLARAAYEERVLPYGELDSVRLAILADALEEAGCTNADILAHCRGPGPHVRGCWVIDLLTGRK